MRRIPRVRVQPGQKFLGAKIDQWTKFPRRQNTSFECRIIRMKRWEIRVRNMGNQEDFTPLQIIFQLLDCRNVNITFSHVK